jgi:hypothetical protein
METRVKIAVHEFISSAPLVLRLPPLSYQTWDAASFYTERDLATMRSLGLLASYSCLVAALVGAAEHLEVRYFFPNDLDLAQ